MGVDALLAALARDAEADVERRRTAATAEAAGLVRDAEARLAADRARALERRERELHADAAIAYEKARATHGRSVLDARQRFLDRVKAAALARAEAVVVERDPPMEAALRDLVVEAASALPPGPLVLRAAPALAAALARVAATLEGLVLRVEAEPSVTSGFLLSPAGGGVTVDQRLVTRLRRQWADLAIVLAAHAGKPRDEGGA